MIKSFLVFVVILLLTYSCITLTGIDLGTSTTKAYSKKDNESTLNTNFHFKVK